MQAQDWATFSLYSGHCTRGPVCGFFACYEDISTSVPPSGEAVEGLTSPRLASGRHLVPRSLRELQLPGSGWWAKSWHLQSNSPWCSSLEGEKAFVELGLSEFGSGGKRGGRAPGWSLERRPPKTPAGSDTEKWIGAATSNLDGESLGSLVK